MPVKRTEWVQQVKGDGSDQAPLVVVDGYVGDSTEPEYVRIYLDSRLSRYVDVLESAVRHQEDIANSNPPGAQRLWLEPNAEIKTAPQTITAKFLDGNVARTYAARAQQTAQAQLKRDEQFFVPLSQIDGCPSLQNPDICNEWTSPILFTTIPNLSAIDGCPSLQEPDICVPWTATIPLTTTIPDRSAVDGCPSSLGCFTNTIDRFQTIQTPIINFHNRVRRVRTFGRRGLLRF